MNTHVETASPQDAELIGKLHFLSHIKSFAPFASERWLATRRVEDYISQWSNFLQEAEGSETKRAWKATIANELVGIVKVSPEGPEEAHLSSMHVHPERQGRGVGTVLMQAAMQFMVYAGYTTTSLGVIQENLTARRFYERHGWAVRELRPNGVEGVPIAIYGLSLRPG